MSTPFALIVEKVKTAGASLAKESARMLAFVAEMDDSTALKEMKSQATAVLAYLAQRKDGSVEEHNAAVKIKARVEHRLGEVLAETVRHTGGRPKKNGDTMSPLPKEIAKKQSSRSQQLAKLAWREIEKRIDAKTKENEKAKQGRIIKELLQERQRKENSKLVEKAILLSDVPGSFQAIVADPPWDWGDEGDVSQLGRGRHEYKAMPFEELLKLPVPDRAQKNCHLYLWITNRSLPKGFALMEAWGFRYVCCLTWCKPSIGMGNYFRGSTEHVLFGIRGSLGLLRSDVGTWFEADRQGKHSTKPKEFYELVESCSPGPWLEMFARGKRNGWATWGAEANA